MGISYYGEDRVPSTLFKVERGERIGQYRWSNAQKAWIHDHTFNQAGIEYSPISEEEAREKQPAAFE